MKKKKNNTKGAVLSDVAALKAKGLFALHEYPNWITGFDFYNNRGEVRKTKNVK